MGWVRNVEKIQERVKMNELEDLKKDVVFDGSKFWLGEFTIGEVDDDMKFDSPFDKEELDRRKMTCLGKIMEC